jgi:chromosome segregation ATPase
LDRITEAFSIQVDNPIAILNQDAAKTFLFKCDPSKLYEFFMRATQLEDCKRDYNVAAEEKNVSEAHIKDKEDSIPDIKREVSVWEKKYQFHQTLENKRETVTKLKTELAWSMAKQAELEFSKASKEMAQQEQKIEKANGYIEKDAITQQNLKKEKLAVEKDIQQLAKESDEFEKGKEGL